MNTNYIGKSGYNPQDNLQPKRAPSPKREKVETVADIAGQIFGQPGSTKRYKAEELAPTDDAGEMELLVEKDEAVKGKRVRDAAEGLNQPEEKSLKIKLKLPKKPQVQAAISSIPPSIWETVTTTKLKIQDRKRIAKELLDQRANIDETNQDGMTPLIWAASNGLISMCTFLVKSKANIDAQDNEGRTALMRAGLSATINKLLIESGANANIRSHDGSTALMFAVRRYYLPSNTQKVLNLLLGVVNTDINAQNNEGLTALICMVQARSTEPSSQEPLVDLMLKKGANVNLKDKSGKTALICAAQNQTYNANVLKALIDNGANVNDADDLGNTALHYATKIDDMRTLINCGADIHQQNKSCLTALGKLVNFPRPNPWLLNDEEMGKFLINANLNRLSSGQKERLRIFSLCLLRTPLLKELRKMVIARAIGQLKRENFKLTAESFRVTSQQPNELRTKLISYLKVLLRPNTKKK